MAALAFPLALSMSNKGFASFCPRRIPPRHARVDLASLAELQILKLCCVRRSIHAHEDMTLPPAIVTVVILLSPFPPHLCPHGISPSAIVIVVDFPPPPLSPHLMLIVRSLPLQHQRASPLIFLTALPMPPPNMMPQNEC